MPSPWTRRALCAAAVIASAAARTSAEDDPKPHGLRPGEVSFRPATGTKVWYRLETSRHGEHKASRKKFVFDGASVSDVEVTVGARGEDGAAEMAVRVVRTTGSCSDTEHPKITFDTAKEPVPRDHPAYQVVHWLAPDSIRVLPDGRVAETAELVGPQTQAAALPRTDPVRREFQNLFGERTRTFSFAALWPALPPKRMGAGAFFETASMPPGPFAPSYRLNLRHEIRSIDDERVVLSTTGGVDDLDPANDRGTSKKKPDASTRRVRSSGFGASSVVDRIDGLVRKASYRFTIVIEQAFTVDGELVAGTSTTVIEQTLTRVEAPAEPPPAPAESGPAAPGADVGKPADPPPGPAPPKDAPGGPAPGR